MELKICTSTPDKGRAPSVIVPEMVGDFLEHALPEITLDEITALFSLLDELADGMGWTNISAKETQAKKRIQAKDDNGRLPRGYL